MNLQEADSRDADLRALKAEMCKDISKLSRKSAWKLHKALNDIKYADNMAMYEAQGLVEKTPLRGQLLQVKK
jgi:hypothetical protein